MRAITHPAPDVIELAERPDPIPGEHQVLIAVKAAGLNRADLLQRAGKYPAPPGWPADIPGLEYAGEVRQLGPGVTRWRTGDRVMGLVGGGAHAELVVVHQDETMAMPHGMSFADAAAIPEAFMTAWDAIVLRGRAQHGDRVLVHAIGSGVGTAAAQLGRLLGLTIVGTSRTAEKLERCQALGMAHGVLTSDADWPAHVGVPMQVIVDSLGAQALEQNLGLLSVRGRLIVLGTMTGGRAPGLNLSLVLRNRLEIIGTAMRSRPFPERAELVARFVTEVLPQFETGTLVPVVDQVLPMTEINEAHRLLGANATFGKVILAW